MSPLVHWVFVLPSPPLTFFVCHSALASTTPQASCYVPGAETRHPRVLSRGNVAHLKGFGNRAKKSQMHGFMSFYWWYYFVRSCHINIWKSAWSRSCLTAATGWLNRQRGVKVGDGPMFGQNGLLYDSNVVGVLAAWGLERNSFPSHSFSWHLSPLYASPTATTLQPQHNLSHPPKASPCREHRSSGHYGKLSQLTVTRPRMLASLSSCPDEPGLSPVQT